MCIAILNVRNIRKVGHMKSGSVGQCLLGMGDIENFVYDYYEARISQLSR